MGFYIFMSCLIYPFQKMNLVGFSLTFLTSCSIKGKYNGGMNIVGLLLGHLRPFTMRVIGCPQEVQPGLGSQQPVDWIPGSSLWCG
jgi:hypothetical protein